MGNKVSGAAFPTEAVIGKIVETCNTFGVVLLKSYNIAVLRKLQQLHEEEGEGADAALDKEGFLLERPPTATEPMERGVLTKLGEVTKNWKRRYFVATEEADNFVVYYFAKEGDVSNALKAKGSIHPCGYVVRHTTPEEDARDSKDKDAGAFGLVLEPLEKKRTWTLRFDSEEARARWRLVLEYAAKKCAAPLARDPLLNDAFKDAYARTRRQMGLRGYYRLDRPEREQLALLCVQVCQAGPLASLYESFGAGAAAPSGGSGAAGGAGAGAAGSGGAAGAAGDSEREKLRAAAEKELDRLVAAIVDGAWAAMLARLELRRDAIEERAETSLARLLADEAEARAEVRRRIGEGVLASAQEAAAPILPAVLGALLRPLYKAHKEAIRMFWHRIHDIVERGLKENELRAFYRDTRWQNSALGPACKKVGTGATTCLQRCCTGILSHAAQGRCSCNTNATRVRLSVFRSCARLTTAVLSHFAFLSIPLRLLSLLPAIPLAPQIRALTRGETDDMDDSAAVKLLSDVRVSMEELQAAMSGVSLYEVELLFEDSLRALIGWGIYSFVAAVEVRELLLTPLCCAVLRHCLSRLNYYQSTCDVYLASLSLQRARGGITPIECLHGVMRSMIHDSKLRQRSALMAIFKAILTPAVRTRAMRLEPVKALEATSVLAASPPPFVFVPWTAPAAGGAAASGGAGAAIAVPSAAPVPKGKKAVAAEHDTVRAASDQTLYMDGDWQLDEVVDEAVASVVDTAIAPRTNEMLAQLDKLPGKLGFATA